MLQPCSFTRVQESKKNFFFKFSSPPLEKEQWINRPRATWSPMREKQPCVSVTRVKSISFSSGDWGSGLVLFHNSWSDEIRQSQDRGIPDSCTLTLNPLLYTTVQCGAFRAVGNWTPLQTGVTVSLNKPRSMHGKGAAQDNWSDYCVTADFDLYSAKH